MRVMTYPTACPNCGAPLVHHVGDSQSAPWLCAEPTGGCGRSWWPSELEPDAQQAWRSVEGDHRGHPEHGPDYQDEIHRRRMADRDTAQLRGTSGLPECVTSMSDDELEWVVRRTRARTNPHQADLAVAAKTAARDRA